MSETVDTSVKSEVLPHLVSQQAEGYGHEDHALKYDNSILQRFNIPLSQVNKVGLRWSEDIRIYNDDNKLYISVLPLDKQNEKIYPEKTEITLVGEHSIIYGIRLYVGQIEGDRVLVTADDLY